MKTVEYIVKDLDIGYGIWNKTDECWIMDKVIHDRPYLTLNKASAQIDALLMAREENTRREKELQMWLQNIEASMAEISRSMTYIKELIGA